MLTDLRAVNKINNGPVAEWTCFTFSTTKGRAIDLIECLFLLITLQEQDKEKFAFKCLHVINNAQPCKKISAWKVLQQGVCACVCIK